MRLVARPTTSSERAPGYASAASVYAFSPE
jgi:hypothetical protein